MARKLFAFVFVALSAGGAMAVIPASKASALGVCLEVTRFPAKVYVQGMPVLGDPNQAPVPKDCNYLI